MVDEFLRHTPHSSRDNPWYLQVGLFTYLRTGEMLFFKPTASLSPVSSQTTISFSPYSSVSTSVSAVDRQLEAQDGRIARRKDPLLCRHAQNGMCPHCAPLDPFDSDYHKKHSIKFLSFWSFIKKEQETLSSILPRLEISFGQCKSSRHLPYPQGMCSACQLSPITLQQQVHDYFNGIIEISYGRSCGIS